MKFVNRVLAALLALGLIVVGALVVLEVIAQRVGSAPVLVRWDTAYSWAKSITWNSTEMRVILIVLALIGLVLLFLELTPASVQRLPVAHSADGVDVAYTRRGVADAVKGAAADVDGIRAARATVKKRSVQVRATSSATEPTAAKTLTDPVRNAVDERLRALNLDPAPTVRVTVNARRP